MISRLQTAMRTFAGAMFALVVCSAGARAEAMLQYFNTSWAEITRKMPELAEAGYTSLWLPPPTKGSGGLSVGYDLWDPFDLGSKDQRGSVRTRYGTEAELLHLVEVAHRFGIRVYFDNIMNHRAFDVPGFNENTPVDIYPGMVPEDFHLRVTEDGFFRKWDNTRDWGSVWQVQNLGLADLIDIAHETPNANFGRTEGSTHPKYSFVRHPNNPEYYDRLPDGTYVGFGVGNGVTREMIAANQGFYTEDVGAYLIRNVRWLMDRTKADGLRLDAVKHVPDYFFGQQSGAGKDESDAGYLGGVQRQFNRTRGFSDANHRDSVFDAERGRDDALVFGEHLGTPPGYSGYWDSGMRLVDNDLRSKLNGVLGSPWGTLAGLDSSGSGGFSASLGVMHANSHDSDYSAMRHLQHAIYYTREGIGLVYTDGYYKAETLGESGGAFPRHANTAFLGQFEDPRIPNLLKIHQDFARGLQQGLWSDSDFLAYERRDNRNPDGSTRSGTAADEITMLVMLNDNNASGQARSFSHSFPSGSYLYQYATGPNGSNQVGFYKYASELNQVVVPPGGYFVFSYRTPETSNLSPDRVITFYQAGREVDEISVTRKDGPDGDSAFNPYGLANRGYEPGQTPVPFSYRTKVPVVKGGLPLTILARADGSAENILLKLDGGIDLNGTVPVGITDPAKRDNPPAIRTDTWVGYEQPLYVDRQHPELFAAKVTGVRDITGSLGAETYTTSGVLNQGSGNRRISGDTAAFLYHDPTAPVEGETFSQYDPVTRRLWAKVNSVGGGFRMFVYYTVDGSTYPEGAGGIGRGGTKVAEMGYEAAQSGPGFNWWASAQMPPDFLPGVSRYKIGIFKTGASSWWPGDPFSVAYKRDMMTTFRIADFDPATVPHHLHNDYNSLTNGLREGFHVVRAKAILPNGRGGRSLGAAPIYQTFTQTFYYDAEAPQGEVAFPQHNGQTIGSSSYEIVVRTDHTVEELWYNIADSEQANNDSETKSLNGNGDGFEPFVDANQNRLRNEGESFTDLNGNGVYDAATPVAWARATEVTANPAVNSALPREWRIRFTNIPASGVASLTFRLLEASSSRDFSLSPSAGHYRELVRTVQTAGPLERVNVAWPQSDGDLVDDSYVLKVYFSKALANGTNSEILRNRFTFLVNGIPQSRTGFAVNYGDFGPDNAYHELSIPLPNLYNDVADYVHELKVEYRFPEPDNRVLEAYRAVRAAPSSKPFVQITQPAEVGSDGRPVEVVLPDGPGGDEIVFPIRVNSSASVSELSVSGNPAVILLSESFVDSIGNGRFDGEEPYVDSNENGQWDSGEVFTDTDANGLWSANEQGSLVDSNGNRQWEGTVIQSNGTSKTWDFPWRITAAGTYLISVSTGGSEPVVVQRNVRVVQRQIVEGDANENNDDDNDGLVDIDETNAKALPTGNAETWTNGDVHVWTAFGRTLPKSPDTDSDGLPDGLELGWRTPGPSTNVMEDTNGDGFPNFRSDLDPPLYAVVENHGFVPGVGSASQGDSRTRQAAGSVTDPSNPDTDSDGLLDGIEDENRNGWVDGDGKSLPSAALRTAYAASRPNLGDWPNGEMESWESWAETSPSKADSDDDALSDGFGEDKNANGSIDGDVNRNRVHDAGEAWTETDPLNRDTDGDGMPDGWEVQNGLNPLDNGTDNLSTALADDGSVREGAVGDPDLDGISNLQELTAGTNPNQPNVSGGSAGEGSIRIGTFMDWTHQDLIALDEYNEGGSQGADVYRTNGLDSSRDMVAFSVRDGGDVAANGDGKFYLRVDFQDLVAFAEQGEVDVYVLIDTGNPGVGERALPDNVDIGTDMGWEVAVGAYSTNSGSVSVDLNRSINSSTYVENPYDFGVERRGVGANGISAIAWSSQYDAVEIAIQRQALLDAGWLGDVSTLNFQVFTTRDGTQSGGPGDLVGRNDIRDSIGDDWLASDYWKDQDNIRINGRLASYFGRSGQNDRGRGAKVMLVAHGNQPILPASQTQSLVANGRGGYSRLIATHETYRAPLALHVTPSLASSLQWAKNPLPNAANDGPAFNQRIRNMVANGSVEILGSTFADHVPKYFPNDFNAANVSLANRFLDGIFWSGSEVASRQTFWAPERVLDSESLSKMAAMGYTHTFADQTRHFVKWFGRTSALGVDGFRINQVNGFRIFPIHDATSEYLDSVTDGGSPIPVRELLSRRARSEVQDQVVVLWRDLGEFSDPSKADSYDANVRWLASRPWVQLVTPQRILSGRVPYRGSDGITYTQWGVKDRGAGQLLVQTAKDWIDHATQENYDNWYFGSAKEEGLFGKTFGAIQPFGQVGLTGHSNAAWQGIVGAALGNSLNDLASAVMGSAMFQTAFHNTNNSNLSKFSTGDYIYPDVESGQKLASFASHSHSQTRFANVYVRVQQWASAAVASTLGAESVDVDLDGSPEYLLFNSRLFAVFEARGGRMTAAWMRDPSTGRIWQVAGHFAAYSGTDTEDEGASNVVGATNQIAAFRTSGFKDWWTIDSTNSGTNAGVNEIYGVSPATTGTGWTFSNGGLTKTIRLSHAASERLQATYQLAGLSKAFVRFGLSPNLLQMMIHGQGGLSDEVIEGGRVAVTHTSGADTVRGFVEAVQINSAATDTGAAGFTTVMRRNQAHTHQVEVELTGGGPHVISLGFDLGTNLSDSDLDGLPDSWEFGAFGNLDQTGSGDPDSDQWTNAQEQVFGSNPTDPSSGAPVTAVEQIPGGFRFSFDTVAGRLYQPEVSTDLGGWVELGSAVSGDGSIKAVTDSTSSGRRFYRVTISLP